MKKFILLIIFFSSFAGTISAQQDAQYTQWMFNKLSLNPGYVVATDYPCISCLHRTQWAGLEGAPTSQSLNLRVPLKKKNVGFGLSINRDVIGPSESLRAGLIYGYAIDFGKGKLGVGVEGALRTYQVKWGETNSILSGDVAVPGNEAMKTFLNVGAGLYYYTPKYYIGLSVPNFINNDISLVSNTTFTGTDFSKQTFHGFLMAGLILNVSEDIKYKPGILFKYAKNAPLDLDLNSSMIFFDKLWLGLTYRLGGFSDEKVGESLGFILQYQFSDPFKLGIAYDYTLSKVRDYNSGTYEIMLEYCLMPKNKNLTNPRFF